MKIFPSITFNSGCDYHRIVNPLRYMEGIEEVGTPETADVFFFNKVTGYNLEALKDMGVKIVIDVDDYWQLPEDHFYYENWRKGKVTERILAGLSIADAVITTNDLLADKIRPFNKNVHVVPNALPYGQGQFKMSQSDWTGKVKFIGGRSHERDIALIHGYGIPARLPVESYMKHYEGVNIALAPLVDNEFNSFKSNLKILEAGAAYAYCLCSDVAPFRGAPIVPVSQGEWEEAIEDALGSPEYVQLKGQRMNMWCREHYELTKINNLRKRVFENL